MVSFGIGFTSTFPHPVINPLLAFDRSPTLYEPQRKWLRNKQRRLVDHPGNRLSNVRDNVWPWNDDFRRDLSYVDEWLAVVDFRNQI
jgi:hypothetical protein